MNLKVALGKPVIDLMANNLVLSTHLRSGEAEPP